MEKEKLELMLSTIIDMIGLYKTETKYRVRYEISTVDDSIIISKEIYELFLEYRKIKGEKENGK